jgi:cyclopropane fatty-acyl-phospholipid synthase-like methyltransferase
VPAGPSGRPEAFSHYTTPAFWNDPHISAQMLALHLDPLAEPASRPHEFVGRSVEWLVPALALAPGSKLLDLGCGPGLYANRIAERGIEVVGIDVSVRSLEHARAVAEQASLPATFRSADYLADDLGGPYDAAIMIYEDYCALSPDQRATLLGRVAATTRPGGRFLFDVTATARFLSFQDGVVSATNFMNGFWAPQPYQCTEETWTYADLHLVLHRYSVTDRRGTREFWNWMHCLSPEQVEAELTASGWELDALLGDVAGAPYRAGAETFAVVARTARGLRPAGGGVA